MSMLKGFESRIAGLVEGAFGRAFRSEVRPVEIARKLAREMEDHRSASLSQTYVPNEYAVYLSPGDRERFAAFEGALVVELGGYLLEHARREGFALLSKPEVSFHTDERLRLGEFGIQAQLVEHPDEQPEDEPLGRPRRRPGSTSVYSTTDRLRAPLEDRRRPAARSAQLTVGGRRIAVTPAGVTIGRSRDCDVVLTDESASRHHAEIRRAGEEWVVRDLGSTNGVRVNGRRIQGSLRLHAGDRLELGATTLEFEAS